MLCIGQHRLGFRLLLILGGLLVSTPDSMRLRRQTVEHPFGTIKAWMGSTHFLARALKNVSAEMSLAGAGLHYEASHEHPRHSSFA
jgi:hypothetical protein